jgi:TolB-like protein/Tfp pilus assembly protein PilF
MPAYSKQIYEFGPFRLNPAARTLLCNGEPVSLSAKVFDLLLVLVQNSGRVIEKAELLKFVWHDAFVEENNLTVSVAALRKALGETPRGHLYIETIPKRGYHFIAQVREVRDESLDRAIDSVAVLPLVNPSDDPDLAYLSDGITESIINSLSRLPHLKVMARSTVFRYRQPEVDPRMAGLEMGVRAVLVGRVLQLRGKLVVRMELVDVADGSQIWGEQYNRPASDIFVVQEEIAREVSEKLRLKLTSEERLRLSKRYTTNTEAYHLYLKGRHLLTKHTTEHSIKAIEFFERAIEIDPNYALAYSGIADSYFSLSAVHLSPKEALPLAKAAAIKAIEIDDELADAHISVGLIKVWYDHDWRGAEQAYKRAIEINPGAALAHQRYATYLAFMGRLDEAMSELKRAQELDPLSLQTNVNMGTLLSVMRLYERAIKQLKKTLELDPNFYPAHYALGCAYIQTMDFEEAVAEFEQVCRLEEDSHTALGYIGHAYARAGKTNEAERVLEELNALSTQQYISPYSIALVYIGLDQKDEAFKWLEKTYEDQNDMLVWLRIAPEVDSLRSDPRFADLMLRVGFQPRSDN